MKINLLLYLQFFYRKLLSIFAFQSVSKRLNNIFKAKKPPGVTPKPATSKQAKKDASNSQSDVSKDTDDVTQDDMYDVVDESQIYPGHPSKFPSPKSSPKQQVVRPILHVPPTSHTASKSNPLSADQKQFYDLTCKELVDRLKRCHMVALAGICEREYFDGSFFKNISDKELKNDFKLSSIDIVKFRRMRDENWVVNE